MTKHRLARIYGPLLLAAVVILLPLILNNNYYLVTLITVGIYTIVVVGLCLLMGYAGQVSLGHGAFYGLGAYGSAILTVKYGLGPWPAMFLALGLTCLVAYGIGRIAFRLRENYLALATLAFGIIIFIFFNEQVDITGGPSGLGGIPYISFLGYTIKTDLGYYYLVWAFGLVAILLAQNIVHSRIGRALRAIHGSEVAAQSLGVRVFQYKLQIFVLSAGFASVAGSLYAHYITFISPGVFSFKASIDFVLMAVVGGLASVWGPLFGVAAVILLGEFLRHFMPHFIPGAGGEYELIFFGVMLVLIIILTPQGLTCWLMDLVKNKRVKFLKLPAAVPPTSGRTGPGAGKGEL
ncbi:MAG: branched-chain amino acid ABC transporter permease [Bacillota bacterium]|jgi:branched-chain amino acid transport system permease protein